MCSSSHSELVQARSKVTDLEEKLRGTRQDGDSQAEKTSQLEKELHANKVLLEEAQSTGELASNMAVDSGIDRHCHLLAGLFKYLLL